MKNYWVLLLALLSIPGVAVAQDLATGKKQFAALCSGCHGSDGGGGEHGPNIVDLGRRGPGQGGRENLAQVIKNGTESGMPAFPLPENQIATLVAYIRDLRAPAADRPAQGNAENGARFFAGKGNCTRCHMVNGSGGTLGPDLSNIGRERRVQQIEQALRKPGSSGDPRVSSCLRKIARWKHGARRGTERKHIRFAGSDVRRQAAFVRQEPDRGAHARVEIADARRYRSG